MPVALLRCNNMVRIRAQRVKLRADKMVTLSLARDHADVLQPYVLKIPKWETLNSGINLCTHTAQEAITLIGVYGHWGPWNRRAGTPF